MTDTDAVIALAAVHAAFWAKVKTGEQSECWPWMASKNVRSGYGQFHPRRGETVHAHRAAYEFMFGPIPEDLVVDHVRAHGCTRLDCCNPWHLEAVPQGENIRRGALGFGDGRCRAGLHDVTNPANVETRPNGKRRCIECRRAAARRRWASGHRSDQP